MKMINHVNKEDIDLLDKLSNMYESEISDKLYKLCIIESNFNKIEECIWNLLNDFNSKFSETEYYKDLALDYDAKDEHDFYSACLYNCDSLYMEAISKIFNINKDNYLTI